MTEKELSELTDQELLEKAKKLKSNKVTNAFFIGFLLGIVIYGVSVNNLGFFALLPLYLAYKLMDNSTKNESLEKILKERNLK